MFCFLPIGLFLISTGWNCLPASSLGRLLGSRRPALQGRFLSASRLLLGGRRRRHCFQHGCHLSRRVRLFNVMRVCPVVDSAAYGRTNGITNRRFNFKFLPSFNFLILPSFLPSFPPSFLQDDQLEDDDTGGGGFAYQHIPFFLPFFLSSALPSFLSSVPSFLPFFFDDDDDTSEGR